MAFEKELFIDHHLIRELRGKARQRIHQPQPQEVVLTFDQPWEGTACAYVSVLQEEGLYRMYYKAWNIPADGFQGCPVVIAYAESKDGIHWERPNLGLIEFEGSKDNNIIFAGLDGRAHDFTPFIDTHPDCRADERYKAVGFTVKDNQKGLYLFKSEDGINWSLMQEEPILTGHPFDTQNIVFYDPNAGAYRMYTREFRRKPDGSRGGRGILTATSDNLLDWSEREWLVFPNDPEEELYTNQIQIYPTVPGLLIGFPARYVDRGWQPSTYHLPELEARKKRSQPPKSDGAKESAPTELAHESSPRARYGAAVTDSLLMTSRDGKTFTRWDEAFVRPGLKTRHNWSYGDNYLSWGLPITPSNRDDTPAEISFYSSESYFTPPHSRLRRLSLRQDGFVSVFAPLSGGELITALLEIPERDLAINFSTSAGGEIRLELLSHDNKPIPGYSLGECPSLFGDDLQRIVRWSGDRSARDCDVKMAYLRVLLHDADLFSVSWI